MRRASSAVRVGLVIAAITYLAGLLAFFAALSLGLARQGWLGFVREAALYLFLPLPVLLLAALLVRVRGALVVLLVPLVLFSYFYGAQFVPRAAADGQAPRFRVLTFNAGGNEGGGRPEPLIRLLQTERADLVALQEIPRSTLEVLGTALHQQYPYQVGSRDAATLSRYPLVNVSDFRLFDQGYLCQQMDVEIDRQLIALTNVHIMRPTAGLTVRRSLSWARGFDSNWRDVQIEALVRHIDTVVGPQLVMGDFNQTDWSPSYAEVATTLEDSFREAGWGFGHTFPSDLTWTHWDVSIPLLRIDYVFHSRDLVAQEAHVGPAGGSHHLPVSVALAFR